MSSKTSSRSTLTTVPSTMSPSLKYLMVSSIAARKASSDPMSLTATCGVVEVASVLLVMCGFGSGTDMSVVVGARRALIVPAEDRSGGGVAPSEDRCRPDRALACSVRGSAGPQRSDQDMRGSDTGQSTPAEGEPPRTPNLPTHRPDWGNMGDPPPPVAPGPDPPCARRASSRAG